MICLHVCVCIRLKVCVRVHVQMLVCVGHLLFALAVCVFAIRPLGQTMEYGVVIGGEETSLGHLTTEEPSTLQALHHTSWGEASVTLYSCLNHWLHLTINNN